MPHTETRGRPRLMPDKKFLHLYADAQSRNITNVEFLDEHSLNTQTVYNYRKRLSLPALRRHGSSPTAKPTPQQLLALLRGRADIASISQKASLPDGTTRQYLRRAVLQQRARNPDIKQRWPLPTPLRFYKIQEHLNQFTLEEEIDLDPSGDYLETLQEATGIPTPQIIGYLQKVFDYRQRQIDIQQGRRGYTPPHQTKKKRRRRRRKAPNIVL